MKLITKMDEARMLALAPRMKHLRLDKRWSLWEIAHQFNTTKEIVHQIVGDRHLSGYWCAPETHSPDAC